jgi:glutamyl-tRNA synthetase
LTVRVRFAPSPTGFVHIGSLRTALYNYLFAKKHNGRFVLRIEDTDRNRFVEGATENLIRILGWAGIKADEGPGYNGKHGPYFQSQRTRIYKEQVEKLIKAGAAYYAFDTPQEIEQMRQRQRKKGVHTPKYDYSVRDQMRNSLSLSSSEVEEEIANGTAFVIRLKIPKDRIFRFRDRIRGEVEFSSDEIDDQVLIKSDGFPTYHLANVVDDHLMEITHIIRGEEWLSSVPKHLFIYEFFKWDAPEMAHLPLIFNPDGSKMSKRNIQALDDLPDGKVDPDVESYRRKGYENSALLNYIALLGWNPGKGTEQEIFMPDELVKEFSLDRVNKSRAIFDLNKLNWLNKEHLGRKPTEELVKRLKPELTQKKIDYKSDQYLYKVVDLVKSRLGFLQEFVPYSHYFFQDPEHFEEKGIKKRWKNDSAKLILEFCREISKLETFDAKSIEEALRRISDRQDVGAGKIIHPVRLAVTGVTVGPGLFELLQILGKETVVRRLTYAAEKVPAYKQQ